MSGTIDLAVVTSAWGAYGEYLPDWAESVACQTVKPAQAVIMDGGVRDPSGLFAALDLLGGADIPVVWVRGPASPMGAARNAAVDAADAEWVMHLDADDMLLSTCLEEVSRHMDTADVVSIGAVEDGITRCFPHINTEYILSGKHGCFSCAPFRKSLWAKKPFQITNDWVDSVFWVGLAYQGAVFVGTEQPGFIYRQHSNSYSRTLSARDRRLARRQWRLACRSERYMPR